MHSKTFRLFVSSTFSDFTQERKLLQTIVFPEIKKYCTKHNLVFQPIDLRWGVTEEASNNQKTLELCLEEVKASKINPHPNFLIMMGDRYGTVILPYAIEKEEFETIQNEVKDEKEKELLNTWYVLDENQIPASYILQERKDSKKSHDGIDYTNRQNWKPINNKFLEILQTAVKNSNLNNEQKKKYTASATEAEIIEGIFKYLHPTTTQTQRLKDNPKLETDDFENVYAYIRNIKSLDNDGLKENLIDKDLTNVEIIKGSKNKKGELQKALDKDNIFSVDAELTNVKLDENDKLDYFYKELEDKELKDTEKNFVSEMTEYLKKSINKHIELIKTSNYTQEELDQFEQERFKDDKLKDFLDGSRTNALKAIDEYLNNDNKDKNQALVVYGRSGLGKSSLMAKAIDETIKQEGKDKLKYSFFRSIVKIFTKKKLYFSSKDKVVYRFVGASSSITTSPQLLISILKEFGIAEEIRTVKDEATGQDKPEPLEKFYYRINDHFRNIKEEKVIYIDAVDQLTTEDEFIWLPNELPSNLKIVISALEDEKYKEDTEYFKSLKTKTDNLYKLEPFTNAEELVDKILKRYDRKITPSQMDYLLDIYKDINTPLYLSVAAQELIHWKSSDKTIDKDPNGQKLASTQQDIIQEYIDNLSEFYHHDKELVKKVFSYLYLSDGLSESELLEILNTDKKFIEKIASDKHHKKENPELPIVIWARLHTQIKEFLKLEEKDGQETMRFFHREFNKVIENQEDIQKTHEHLIELLQKLIVEHQNKPFDSNRWGKLYIEVLKDYHIKYEFEYLPNDNSMLFKYCNDLINQINNEYYKKELLSIFNKSGFEYTQVNKTKLASYYLKSYYYISKDLYSKNPERWLKDYTRSLNNVALTLKNVSQLDEALILQNEALEILKIAYEKNPERWLEYYVEIENQLINFLNNIVGQRNKAVILGKRLLKIIKKAYEKNPERWIKVYTTNLVNLSVSYEALCSFDLSENLRKEAFDILKEVYEKDPETWLEDYLISLMNFALSKAATEQKESLKLQKEAFEILKEAYKKNPERWIEYYVNCLNNLADILRDLNQYDESIEKGIKSLEIIKEVYSNNNERWIKVYLESLNNLIHIHKSAFSKKEVEDGFNQIVKTMDTSLIDGVVNSLLKHKTQINKEIDLILVELKKIHKRYPEIWLEDYSRTLVGFADWFEKMSEYEKELDLLREAYKINPRIFILEAYTESLNRLAILCFNNNQYEKSVSYWQEAINLIKIELEKNSGKWSKIYKDYLCYLCDAYYELEMYETSTELMTEWLELEKLYIKYLERFIDITSPTEAYITKLIQIADSYLKLKEFKLSSGYFQEYFEILNMDMIESSEKLSVFIYPFVKYYQAKSRLKEEISGLEILAKDWIEKLKDKFPDDYDEQLQKEYEDYLSLRDSDDQLTREKFEIFEKIFIKEN